MTNETVDFFSCGPWMDDERIPSVCHSAEIMEPKPQRLSGDGPIAKDADQYWQYQFDVMIEAESALHTFIGLLVDFRQVRKMAHFLMGTADLLEFSIPKDPQRFLKFRFRFDFAPGVSLEYSSQHCGCMIWINGRQDTLHKLSIPAMAALRDRLGQVWEVVKAYPVWDVLSETELSVTVRRRPLT